MRQLREAARRFVAKHIVAEDPYSELSRLDREDSLALEACTPDVLRFEPDLRGSQVVDGTANQAA